MYQLPKNPIKNGFLSDIIVNGPCIAFVLDKSNKDEISFRLLKNLYKIDSRLDTVIFTQDWSDPILTPPTGFYHISDCTSYQGDLVVTSVNSYYDALRFRKLKHILLYIYNPHELTMYPPEEVQKSIKSRDNIILCCRSETHKKFIFDNFKLEAKVIEDFDLSKIKETLGYKK